MGVDVTLTTCRWRGRGFESTEVRPATAADVSAAVVQLDGAEFNDLYLTPDDSDPETYFSVGGGPDLFLVFLCLANERFHDAYDPAGSDEEVLLVTGGQTGSFARRQLIDRSSALRAALTYCNDGSLDESVSWDSR